jgi:hypothetical protein
MNQWVRQAQRSPDWNNGDWKWEKLMVLTTLVKFNFLKTVISATSALEAFKPHFDISVMDITVTETHPRIH